MKVFKFGGASVSTAERIRKLPSILESYRDEKLLIVISAMGKTTNALEKVAMAFYEQDPQKAVGLFEQIKKEHLEIAGSVLVFTLPAAKTRLLDFFTEVEWLLHDRPSRDFDYYYDQIVCIGELLSTAIISYFLEESGLSNHWVDVRDIFCTDDQFRNASLHWEKTVARVNSQVRPLFDTIPIVLTQGFIGATDANESVTLGREGSDYSAAIFANMLDADSQTIWKDVEGVMNADPKAFPEARIIPELNYDEVIEMAYYGAQVIHPKTIKPLQNKGIPLYVKCFLDKDLPGTVIHSRRVHHLPPIIVVKTDQVLFHFKSKDFSFVGESLTGDLYKLLSGLHIQPNLMQSGAVILQVCVDDDPRKTERLALEAAAIFDVSIEKGLTMLTVRHYHEKILDELIGNRKIILQQRSDVTAQTLLI
jgi:aspartate kinase